MRWLFGFIGCILAFPSLLGLCTCLLVMELLHCDASQPTTKIWMFPMAVIGIPFLPTFITGMLFLILSERV